MDGLYLFKRAKADYKVASLLFNDTSIDGKFLYASVAFMLEQAVEKVLKGFLTLKGEYCGSLTAVSKLINLSNQSSSPCLITPWVMHNKNVLDDWEDKARYSSSFMVYATDVLKGLHEVADFLELNGISDKLNPKVTDEIKKHILKVAELEEEPSDNLEWNVLYIVYKDDLVEVLQPPTV